MRAIGELIIAGLLLVNMGWAQKGEMPLVDANPAIRFDAIDLYIDTGDDPLAAYQLDLSAAVGDVKIVGLEGGEHPAFSAPPYYDPAAMQGDRVIIADFSTAAAHTLPTGKTRIATIHVQIIGDIEPKYSVELQVSATSDGKGIPAEFTLETGQE